MYEKLWILLPIGAGLLLIVLLATAIIVCIRKRRTSPAEKNSKSLVSSSYPDTDVESANSALEYQASEKSHGKPEEISSPPFIVADERESAKPVIDVESIENEETYDTIPDSAVSPPPTAVAPPVNHKKKTKEKTKKAAKGSQATKKKKRKSHASKNDQKELLREKKGRATKSGKSKSKSKSKPKSKSEDVYIPDEDNRPVNDGPNPLTSVTEDSHNMFIY